MPHYANEQIQAANGANLVTFLYAHRENLKRCGQQYLWEKYQVWIRSNEWYTR